LRKPPLPAPWFFWGWLLPDSSSIPGDKDASIGSDELRGLIEPYRVHRRVYSDPAVFRLEMERIYGRAWIIVGHKSQVPAAGDFITTRIGVQPVIMVRHTDDTVRVLFNRCPHRGATICVEDKGSVRSFRCPYHSWAFETDGRQIGIPVKEAYPDYESRASKIDMTPLPRVAEYRGFVFASLAPTGPGLEEFLGWMRSSLDDIVDRAPEGDVEIAGGVFRHRCPANWKLIIENSNDMLHAGFLHQSAVDAARAVDTAGFDPPFAAHRVENLRSNGAPLKMLDESGTSAFPFGHSFIGGLPRRKRSGAIFERYRAMLVERHGEARTEEILSVDRHLNMIYPNLLTNGLFGQLKIINPIAVDMTEITVYPVRLKGAPPEVFHATINFVNNANSTAGLALADDLEIYKRCQDGFSVQASEWIDFGRGSGLEQSNDKGGKTAPGTHELPMRNQFKAWLDYMTA
jgi:benzoate/toluate 1,2-dioxygenase subunit alpha